MKSKLPEFIDFEKVNSLLEGFNKTTGFVTAILDLEGNVLSKSGWRQICTEFHRIHPETAKRCRISDTELANKMAEGEKYHFYKCLNGLVDVAVPLIINGEHIANLFSGQFFFKKPDRNFFKKQAEKYGFDEKKYLQALDKVPVVSEEKVRKAMDFLLNMTQLISEITLQKQQQSELNKELKESEQRYRTIFENTGTATCILEKDGTISLTNTKFTQLAGYPIHEIENKKTWMEFVVPEDLDRMRQQHELRRKNRQEALTEYEFRFIGKNKIVKNIFLTIDVIPGTDKSVASLLDITERKQAEEKLKFNYGLLRIAGETARFGGWDVNLETNISTWSDAVADIHEVPHGYAPPVDEGINFYAPEWRDKITQVFTDCAQKGIPYDEEMEIITSKGKRVWVRTTGRAVKDENGKISKVHGSFQDITQSKRIEQEIREQKDLLTAIYRNAPLVMMVVNAERRIQQVNGFATQFAGRDAEEMLGLRGGEALRCMHMLDDPQGCGFGEFCEQCVIRNTVLDTIETGKTFLQKEAPYYFKGEDNQIKEMTLMASTTPIMVKSERMVLVTLQDITESKQAEEVIKKEKAWSESIVNNAPNIIIGLGEKSIIKVFNHYAERLTGYKAEEVIGKEWINIFVPKELKKKIYQVWDEIVKNKLIDHHLQNEIIIKSGEKRLIEWSNTILTENDEFQMMLSIGNDITERKQIENELKEKTSFLSTIMETSPVGIVTIDKTGNITYANNRAEQILGLEKEQITSQTYNAPLWKSTDIDGSPFPEGKLPFNLVKKSLKTVLNIQHGITWPDGTVVILSVNAAPIKDHNGEFNGMIASIEDISDSKQAEKALRESEERFKALHNASFGGITIHDKGVILECNQGLSDITGYALDELIGMDGLLLIAPESRDMVMDNILAGYEKPYEAIGLRKNGEKYALRLEARNVPYKGKQVRTVEFRDITESKKADEALKESEEKYRLLVENQTDLIVKVDTEGRFLFVSQSYCQLFGKTKEELLRQVFMPLVHEEDRQPTAEAMKKLYQPPYKIYLEQRAMTKNGWQWLAWVDTAVLDGEGKVQEIIGVGRDITDRKKAENELRKLKENLESEVKQKTKELQKRVAELERFQEATIEREFRIKELRDELELLKKQLSKH